MRYRQTCCYDSAGAIVTKALRSVRLAATKTSLYRDWYAHCIVCTTLGSGLHCSLALVASGREVITDWIPQAFKNQVQTKPLLGFLSQNVIVVTCVAIPAGCL